MTDENPRKLFHHEATRRTVQRDVDERKGRTQSLRFARTQKFT